MRTVNSASTPVAFLFPHYFSAAAIDFSTSYGGAKKKGKLTLAPNSQLLFKFNSLLSKKRDKVFFKKSVVMDTASFLLHSPLIISAFKSSPK